MLSYPVNGSGLGLRRDLTAKLKHVTTDDVDFFEVAPENWIKMGGKIKKQLEFFLERFPFVFHGLSLSIGGPSPLDESLVLSVKKAMKDWNIAFYTDHLSYCSDHGHLYDLMPIPFTEEAVEYVAQRIRRVQDILETSIAVENVSYYAAPSQEMTELEFTNAVLERADCRLLLDVNNIYVNSINHGYDAEEFLTGLPGERIVYGHIAGHFDEAEDLKVDTHGADVKEDVWNLLEKAYESFGVFPTLLERDFNYPPIEDLLTEVSRIRALQNKWMLIHEQQASQRISSNA